MVPAQSAMCSQVMSSSPSAPSSTTTSPLYARVPFDVHHDLVHADAAHHRVLLAADEHVGHVGERAEVAVAVAHRHRDHPHRVVGLPRGAVAHRVAGLHHLEVDDARLAAPAPAGRRWSCAPRPRDRRRRAGCPAAPCRGGSPAAAASPPSWPCAARAAPTPCLSYHASTSQEARELQARGGEVGGVGVGEVGVDALHHGVPALGRPLEQAARAVVVHADPLHPVSILRCTRAATPICPRDLVDLPELVDRRRGQGEAVAQEDRDLVAEDAAHDQDGQRERRPRGAPPPPRGRRPRATSPRARPDAGRPRARARGRRHWP